MWQAAHEAGFHPDVFIEDFEIKNSRLRKFGYEVKLAAHAGKDRYGKTRTRRNTGRYGAEDAGQEAFYLAATWDEWGHWIAELFERDPDAIIGEYRGRDDFHAYTSERYLIKDQLPSMHDETVAHYPGSYHDERMLLNAED